MSLFGASALMFVMPFSHHSKLISSSTLHEGPAVELATLCILPYMRMLGGLHQNIGQISVRKKKSFIFLVFFFFVFCVILSKPEEYYINKALQIRRIRSILLSRRPPEVQISENYQKCRSRLGIPTTENLPLWLSGTASHL